MQHRITVTLTGAMLFVGTAAFLHTFGSSTGREQRLDGKMYGGIIYDASPFQIGGPSESQLASTAGEIAWFGYPYWMIITQAREKIRDLGPDWPIMNHRLLIAFMTRQDAEEFVKVASPTAITCGKMTPRSDTYDTALIAKTYKNGSGTLVRTSRAVVKSSYPI